MKAKLICTLKKGGLEMKKFIEVYYDEKSFNEALEYIRSEFGKAENCCEVLNPPIGSVVEILEPLETCYNFAELGLQDGCVPTGTYRIIWVKGQYGRLHWCWIEPINGGSPIKFCGGDGHRTTVDWRGVKRSPLSPLFGEEWDDLLWAAYERVFESGIP